MADWITPILVWDSSKFYNFGDLNRVENNTAVVAELISHFDTVSPLETIDNRTIKRIEFADSLNRIESNQDVLRQRYTPKDWIARDEELGEWKANDPFDYQDAARLENNLALLYFYYQGNFSARPYCGAYTCGEEVI